MQGWALCVVCLYVGIGLFNWLTGLHWLAEFRLPMSVLAGLGLAIASTASPTVMGSSQSNSVSADSAPLDSSETPPTETPVPQSSDQQTESSISFTIHKDVRPS